MKKLTVYGLPLNPTSMLEQLKGSSFCVSYATREKLGKQLDDAIRLVGQDGILLVDNGAFSMHKKGVSTRDDEYLEAYAEWANDILDRCPQAIAVYPDIIGGTEEDNYQLITEMGLLLDSDRCMPVWHLHESIDYLVGLCERFNFIAFGSSGEYWQVGTEKWHARVREAFAAIDKFVAESEGCYVRPRIHMMRAQSMAHLYSFDSTDSTNVAMNHGRQRRLGEELTAFAARIDGKIQKSAGPEAEHQIKQPLLDHLETSAMRLKWLLMDAGYQVTFTDDPPADVDAWLEQYHKAA